MAKKGPTPLCTSARKKLSQSSPRSDIFPPLAGHAPASAVASSDLSTAAAADRTAMTCSSLTRASLDWPHVPRSATFSVRLSEFRRAWHSELRILHRELQELRMSNTDRRHLEARQCLCHL